jgi:NADP-reducing hydrogenase subunit HndC
MMGSGGIVVIDEDNCMVDVARFFVEFTNKESAANAPSAASAPGTCRLS